MRSRTLLFTIVLLAGSLVLPLAAHAAIPFFGHIIPDAYNRCPASWGLLITVVNNLISLLITLVIVFVAPIMIAYAGFLFVINPVNASGKEKAKSILTNTVVGIVVAMAGWLIVDAVMAVLYNKNAVGATWSSLITSGGIPPCMDVSGSLTPIGPGQVPATGVSATGTLSSPPVGKAGTPCDPAMVKTAAAVGGYTLSATQSNILACIALPESSCRSNPPPNKYWNNPTGPGGKASTAAGAFQVLLASNSICYENVACYSAAVLTRGETSLNCSTGFNPNGTIKDPVKVEQCLRAANNLNCSASAAACLLSKNGGSFSPWQADVNSAKQTGCITSGA